MTPGERQHDIELVKNMRATAKMLFQRTRRIAMLLNQAAARLDALSSAAPIERIQPASTPEQPARD